MRKLLLALTFVLVSAGCASDTTPAATPFPDGPQDDGLVTLPASTRFEATGGTHDGGEPVEAEPFTYDADSGDCGIGSRYGTPEDGFRVTTCERVEGAGGRFVVAAIDIAGRPDGQGAELWIACGGGDEFSPILTATAAAAQVEFVFAATEQEPFVQAAVVSLTLPHEEDLAVFMSVVSSEEGESCPNAYDVPDPFPFEIDTGEQHGSARISVAGGGQTTCLFRIGPAQWRASIRPDGEQPC